MRVLTAKTLRRNGVSFADSRKVAKLIVNADFIAAADYLIAKGYAVDTDCKLVDGCPAVTFRVGDLTF